VSQAAVERTIGKLATDEQFRARFFANPAAAAWEAGLSLSPIELEALATLSRAALTRFSQSLDTRISRLCVGGAKPEREARP
jgi:Ser/Thr protein kinase RdoA (MazF antagonist)